jgi:fido (protein-threonine AMPylation protein)
VADEKLLCPLEKKSDIEIANQVEVAHYLADFVKKGRKRITEGDILQIHALTIEGLYPCAGHYRDALTKIEITDTQHKPAHPSQVRIEVNDMLEWLYSIGREKGSVHRAAHVLWKVNHTHPFNGGNGRVARSLAYLVIATEVAPVFQGEPLPAKLKKRKPEYIAGLKSADRGDLAPLEKLVLECFAEQIAEISRP